jgi:hypothetical protein
MLLTSASTSVYSVELEAKTMAVDQDRSATYLKIDLKAFDIKVLSAVKFANGAATGYSLENYLKLGRAAAVLSGGYLASFAPPMPLGLVKSDGVVTNKSHNTWVVEGILCTKEGQLVIRTWSAEAEEDFPDCLQAGPILLLKGKEPSDLPSRNASGYLKLAKSAQEQTFLCTLGDQQVAAGVTDKMDLPTLVDFLRGKIGCVDAIRLTGKDTAGLRLMRPRVLYGNDAYLFPDAIAVVPH